MPWPARMTGRFALLISASCACSRFSLAGDEVADDSRAAGRGCVKSKWREALLRVFGDVDEHRAGAAGLSRSGRPREWRGAISSARVTRSCAW